MFHNWNLYVSYVRLKGISECSLVTDCHDFVNKLQKSYMDLKDLEVRTLGQSECVLWNEERKIQLTASFSGEFVR